MKPFNTLLLATLLAGATSLQAAEVKSVSFGNTVVFYQFETTESEVAILTLNALVNETNNSLRGLKNTDRRRLGKLGQLIYQCKLMLYRSGEEDQAYDLEGPVLISKNYSLYSGVDQRLAPDERIGIRVEALREIDEDSLFTASLGSREPLATRWEVPAIAGAGDLRQFDVNLLQQENIVATSENLDIVVRFPVFQLEKPVREWSYNFDLRDFRQAVRHIDDNCTPTRMADLVPSKG